MSTQIQKVPETHVYSGLPASCRILQDAKAKSGLTYEQIAQKVGKGEVYVAAVFFGQMKPTIDELKAITAAVNVPFESVSVELGDGFYPQRGITPMPPTDPTLYRLYEAVMVFGQPIKQVIHEKFGDGIMSAINFSADVQKKTTEAGERVIITFNGKWLPYAWTS